MVADNCLLLSRSLECPLENKNEINQRQPRSAGVQIAAFFINLAMIPAGAIIYIRANNI